MQVLVVDDSQIMRRIVIGALNKAGISDTLDAPDGREAIKILSEKNTVNLVLMDWNMPNMTGIEAIREIRAKNIKVPIIMVTTEGEKEKVIEAIKSGANDYLVKPFSPKDIQLKLEKFLKSEGQ
ncbi:MAG: two-component system response regulator [candidate division Zixibacteria bacterium CG_4_9_14_3_um_filter_46_8]|nr:MAG: two-component system response regulator [candidate division Zixibacteria bacterium CG_4_9_14_3_um_filter_46_8]